VSHMVQLFPSSIAAAVFYLVYFLLFTAEVVGGAILPRLHRRGTRIAKKDKGSSQLISLSNFISVVIAFSFALSGTAMLPNWVFYPGVVLMVLGIVLRQWSMAVLGSFFSGTVGIQEGQKIVEMGPYRLVRHPAYTGALLILMGLGLALQSWGAILLLVLLFGLAFGYRIYVEERVLVSELDDEYVKYTKRTKRLIPYIL